MASSQTRPKLMFDLQMDELEKKFKLKDDYLICKQTNQTLSTLDRNIYSLKKIEPYYDWKNIKALLLDLKRKYCKN